jgi:hypothetical protein
MPFFPTSDALGQSNKQNQTTLCIKGYPPIQNIVSLTTSGPKRFETVSANPLEEAFPVTALSLFIARSPDIAVPLTIGVTHNASGNADLYVNGAVGGSATDNTYQGYATLSIKPTSGTSDTVEFPLFIDTFTIGTGTVSADLFIDSIMNISSGDISIAVSGGLTSAAGDTVEDMTLAITNRDSSDTNIPLFIDKGFNTSNTATLYVNSRMGSGHLPVAINGANIGSGNLALHIHTPLSGTITMYTRGF